MGYTKLKDFLRNFINAMLPACGIERPKKENSSELQTTILEKYADKFFPNKSETMRFTMVGGIKLYHGSLSDEKLNRIIKVVAASGLKQPTHQLRLIQILSERIIP